MSRLWGRKVEGGRLEEFAFREAKGGRKTRRKTRGGQNKVYEIRDSSKGGRKTRRKTRGGSESNNFNNPYWNPKQ